MLQRLASGLRAHPPLQKPARTLKALALARARSALAARLRNEAAVALRALALGRRFHRLRCALPGSTVSVVPCRRGVDFVAASFVQSAADIAFIRQVLGPEGAPSKLERGQHSTAPEPPTASPRASRVHPVERASLCRRFWPPLWPTAVYVGKSL